MSVTMEGSAEMKRLLIAAASVFLLVGGASSAALAGEVKGPPNQANNTNETGALDHANSACAASGLNDFDSAEGQVASQVQTAADSWKVLRISEGRRRHSRTLPGRDRASLRLGVGPGVESGPPVSRTGAARTTKIANLGG